MRDVVALVDLDHQGACLDQGVVVHPPLDNVAGHLGRDADGIAFRVGVVRALLVARQEPVCHGSYHRENGNDDQDNDGPAALLLALVAAFLLVSALLLVIASVALPCLFVGLGVVADLGYARPTLPAQFGVRIVKRVGAHRVVVASVVEAHYRLCLPDPWRRLLDRPVPGGLPIRRRSYLCEARLANNNLGSSRGSGLDLVRRHGGETAALIASREQSCT